MPERVTPVLPLWLALIVAAAGGFILDLAFPDTAWWPMAFLAIAACLVSLIGRSIGGAMLVGLVFGAVFYFIHIGWITRYLGPLPLLGLAGIETILWSLASVLITLAYRWLPRVAPGPWAGFVALPALVAATWSARELFLGNWPYTGFPWARIGMSQVNGPLAEVASWTGVTGLTFLCVFVVAAAVEFVRRGARWQPRVLVAAGVAVLMIVLPQYPTTPAGELRVGAVQGNGPAGYFDERPAFGVLDAQHNATLPIIDEDLDLLLWPEGAVDADPLSNASVAQYLGDVATQVDAPFILNAATQRGDDTFNTSMLWLPGAEEPEALSDKRFPVPMGEYVPDRWFFEAIAPDLIGLIRREYTPGTNPPYFDVEGVGVGLAICFDVLYDSVIHESILDGAEVLMFQTNNADFRGTEENLQQLGFARMRAIETGRSVVNISTVGTSQVIAPNGEILQELPVDEPGAIVADVELRTGVTPAVLVGRWVDLLLGWGSVLCLLVLRIVWGRRKRRTTRTSAAPEGDARSDVVV